MYNLKSKEKRTHGSLEFPFAFYSVNPFHSRYTMLEHWHSEFEIIRITEGRLDIRINQSSYSAKKDTIIFINSGALHSAIPFHCTYECIVFDLSSLLTQNIFLASELNKILSHSKEIINIFNDHKESYKLLDKLFSVLREKEKGYQFKTFGILYSFFGTIKCENLYKNNNILAPLHKKRLIQIKKILSFIHEHYMDEISLNDLAILANMNERYFCKFFKKMLGKTPIDYLNYYRITCACNDLKLAEKSITEIAYDSGYNDTSYFTKVFKKYIHITPKEYLANFKDYKLANKSEI